MSTSDPATLNDPELRRLALELQRAIMDIGYGLTWRPDEEWIACRYLDSQHEVSHIASIRFYPERFVLYAHNVDEDGRLAEPKYTPMEFSTGDEDPAPHLEMIKRSYRHLGGRLQA